MSAQEREWQPGDKVYVVGEVTDVMGNVVDVRIAHPCTDGANITTWTADLRPVPGGGEASTASMTTIPDSAMSAAMSAFARYNSGRIPSEVVPHAIGAVIWAALDAMGGVPGRSEAEIKGEALREAADELEASQQFAVDFHGNRFAVCGTPWLRARAARVAGTTEAGDDRG